MIDPAFIGRDKQAKGNPVALLQPSELISILYFEGHGHGGHVVGNGLVLNDYGPLIGLKLFYYACDLKVLNVRTGNRRRGSDLQARSTPGNQNPVKQADQKEEREFHQTSSNFPTEFRT